jgi:Right handed beta helix region
MNHRFTTRTLITSLFAACLAVVFSPGLLSAVTQVNVDCNNPKAKIKTITAALAQVPISGPSTLLISGTCRENVTIQGFNMLTLQGNPTATIDGRANSALDAIDISESHVTLNNLTLSGGAGGLGCIWMSACIMDHVTIQDTAGIGLGVQRAAFARGNLLTIERNLWGGVAVSDSTTLVLRGATIQGNGGADLGGDGITIGPGGFVYIYADDTGVTPSVIQNHLYGNGISMGGLATLTIGPASITGNAMAGIALGGGAIVNLGGTTITGNGNHGVRIGPLSMIFFQGQRNTVSGNTGLQVVCDPPYSTTRGIARLSLPDGETNCPAEIEPNP